MRKPTRNFYSVLLTCFFLFGYVAPAKSYSVLTHQAIIDVVWQNGLVPVLKKKYPHATPEELRIAHAHAYGGAIIQDMGYYPFGSKFFTNVVHYVRTGDFILNLIAEAQSLNEYAFALGALAHYYADNNGHPLATNKAVPLVYPKLKKEYGEVITYEQDPLAHVKMELGFDVLQVARGNYAPENYHDFIGFEVSKEVLERAFRKTYGLELNKQFMSLDLAIGTYRRTVSNFFPALTKAAWNMKADEIQKAKPGATRRQFQYRISKASYTKTWGNNYREPNLWEKFLSWMLRLLPKIGPQRPLTFKPPTPEAEKLFMQSFTATVDKYSLALKATATQTLQLSNTDFDTGEKIKPGDYGKADETHLELLLELAKLEFKTLTPDLKKALLQYYAKPEVALKKEEDEKEQKAAKIALQQLRAADAH
ncbi:MAG: zinc dependent phospholipase C family protein [Adhaeribacter sp.]